MGSEIDYDAIDRLFLRKAIGVIAETPEDFFKETRVSFRFNSPIASYYWLGLPFPATLIANIPECAFYRDFPAAEKFIEKNAYGDLRSTVSYLCDNGYMACPICNKRNSCDLSMFDRGRELNELNKQFSSSWIQEFCWGANYGHGTPICEPCFHLLRDRSSRHSEIYGLKYLLKELKQAIKEAKIERKTDEAHRKGIKGD